MENPLAGGVVEPIIGSNLPESSQHWDEKKLAAAQQADQHTLAAAQKLAQLIQFSLVKSMGEIISQTARHIVPAQ